MRLLDQETGTIYQCARWIGHNVYVDSNGEAWDHMTKEDVLGVMAGSLLLASGQYDEEVLEQHGTLLSYALKANEWYRRVVIE